MQEGEVPACERCKALGRPARNAVVLCGLAYPAPHMPRQRTEGGTSLFLAWRFPADHDSFFEFHTYTY